MWTWRRTSRSRSVNLIGGTLAERLKRGRRMNEVAIIIAVMYMREHTLGKAASLALLMVGAENQRYATDIVLEIITHG